MMRSTSLCVAAMSVMIVSGFAAHASAAVLFSDNFENVNSGDSPSPTVGQYIYNGVTPSSSDSNGLVQAGGAGGFPAATLPSGGANYLRIEGSGVGNRNAASLATPAGAGSVFRMEFDYYVAANGVGFGFGSELAGEWGQSSGNSSPSAGRPRASALFRMTSTQVQVFKDSDGAGAGGNSYVNTGITFALNTWQRYVLEYNFGSNELTLSAGSQTPVTITAPFASLNATTPITALSQVNTVFVYTTSTTAVGYADNLTVTGTAIPEPVAASLFGGAALLMFRRLRKA